MYEFWANVRTNDVGFIRVTIWADNPWQATQMLRGMYGDRLLTEAAQAPRRYS